MKNDITLLEASLKKHKRDVELANERVAALQKAGTAAKGKSNAKSAAGSRVPIRYNILSSSSSSVSDYDEQVVDDDGVHNLQDSIMMSDGGVNETSDEDHHLQKVKWLIRHSGTTPLRCSMFCGTDGAPAVDECISLRDEDNERCYTSYVHTTSRCRQTAIRRYLTGVSGIFQVKIFVIPRTGIQSSQLYWNIASGIMRNSGGLTIETTRSVGDCCLFGPFRAFICFGGK